MYQMIVQGISGMMTSLSGNTDEFPAQRPVTRSFDVFFDLHLNKRLNKQPWGWWFETQSCLLWRHCTRIIECMDAYWLVLPISFTTISLTLRQLKYRLYICVIFVCISYSIRRHHGRTVWLNGPPCINIFEIKIKEWSNFCLPGDDTIM